MRLIIDPYYYVTSRGRIVFIESSRKILCRKAESLISREGDFVVTKGTLKNNSGFKVRVANNGGLTISHPEIMDSRYLQVYNLYDENLTDILEHSDVIGGEIQGDHELAIIESGNGNDKIYLINPGMPEYGEAWKETTRVINIMRHKKTRTLTVGHRYDIANNTFWYLGITGGPSNLSAPDGSIDKYYMFVTDLPVGAKTVTDVLKSIKETRYISKLTQHFGKSSDTLLLATTGSLMTDSGAQLEPDLGMISEFWLTWLENQAISKDPEDYGSSIGFNSFQEVCRLIRSTCGGEMEYFKDHGKFAELSSRITEVMTSLSRNLVINYIDRDMYNNSLCLKSTDPLENKIKTLNNLIEYSYPGNNEEYKFIVHDFLGIDLEQILKGSLEDYDKIDFKDFDNYYKYSYRHMSMGSRAGDVFRSVNLINNDSDDQGLVRGLFKNQIIGDTVIEMLELAQESLGLVSGIFDYLGIYRYNRKSEVTINVKLTLKNLIDYLGGLDKLSEFFKKTIVEEDFLVLDISFRRDTVFK